MPEHIPVQPHTVEQLRLECHRLIEQISKHPGAAKLLLNLLPLLQLYSKYKQRRSRIGSKNSN